MRLGAFWLLTTTLFAHGCATKCNMNRCPDELSNSSVTVSYYDGSANGYIFRGGAVEYRPVKPEESSSGTYSGGKPFKRPLDAATSAKIAHAFNTAIEAKAAHIEDRVMMSGVISIECGDESRKWIIAPRSAELEAIETLMTELKAAGKKPAQP